MKTLMKWVLENSSTRSEALAKLRGAGDYKTDEEVLACEEEIKKMEVLTVFGAIELGPEEIRSIAKTIRDGWKGEFTIDFRREPGIIAGCKLVWMGKMGDFSLKRKMEEKKEEIRKIVLN